MNDVVLFGFGFGLVGGGDGDVMKGHVVAGRQLVKLTVVADNGTNVNGQQATFPAEQQIVQAMALFADQNDRAHGLGGAVQVPGHVEGGCKTDQLGVQIGFVHWLAGKLHAHEKQACCGVVVLSGFFNVAAAFQQKPRNSVHDARSVGAGKRQNVGMIHGGYCRREGGKVLYLGPS